MNLRQLRESKDLTQDELAAKTDGKLTQAAVSALELGKVADPKLSTFDTLATALGVARTRVENAWKQTNKEKAEAAA